MDSIGFPIYFIALAHAMAFAQRKGKVAWIMWAGGSPPQLFRGGEVVYEVPPPRKSYFYGGGQVHKHPPPPKKLPWGGA